MKVATRNTAVVLAALISSTAAFASAPLKCPAGTEQVLTCKGVHANDNVPFAVNFVDAAMICQDSRNENFIMLLSHPVSDEVSPEYPMKEMIRAGATEYSMKESEVEFALSYMGAMPSGRGPNSSFKVTLPRGGFDGGRLSAKRAMNCK